MTVKVRNMHLLDEPKYEQGRIDGIKGTHSMMLIGVCIVEPYGNQIPLYQQATNSHGEYYTFDVWSGTFKQIELEVSR